MYPSFVFENVDNYLWLSCRLAYSLKVEILFNKHLFKKKNVKIIMIMDFLIKSYKLYNL
jgi:hypothetical protein